MVRWILVVIILSAAATAFTEDEWLVGVLLAGLAVWFAPYGSVQRDRDPDHDPDGHYDDGWGAADDGDGGD